MNEWVDRIMEQLAVCNVQSGLCQELPDVMRCGICCLLLSNELVAGRLAQSLTGRDVAVPQQGTVSSCHAVDTTVVLYALTCDLCHVPKASGFGSVTS